MKDRKYNDDNTEKKKKKKKPREMAVREEEPHLIHKLQEKVSADMGYVLVFIGSKEKKRKKKRK